MAKEARRPARRHGSLLLHLLLLLVLAAVGWQLRSMQGQLQDAQAEKDRTAQQVESMKQSNDALRADIAEGATDEKMKELARDELGLTEPNEYVFYDQSN